MIPESEILQQVRAARAKRTLFLPHAIKAMARPTPIISRSEVESVVLFPEPAQWSPDFRERRP